MHLSRTAERIGLTMLRWGTKRPVLLIEPPSWTVQYLNPIAPCPLPSSVSPVGKAGAWIIRRANPLAYINSNGSAIKVTLP